MTAFYFTALPSSLGKKIKQSQQAEVKRNMATMLQLHFAVRFYFALTTKHDMTVLKDDLIEMLSAPFEVITHLGNSFTKFTKIKGQPAFVATKMHMYGTT